MLRIGLVAGEASGDLLGAGLIKAINQTTDHYSLEGIGGDKLASVGMAILYPMERLSVMGLTEVLGRYRELKKIRTHIRDHFIQTRPDVFIGIDAPDFNLWLERELRNVGITTVHYVSPSVWAWREYRIKKIKQSVDLMLNLFPFETAIYNQYKIPNRYVGHPLADALPIAADQSSARKELGLARSEPVLALLPGSRANEIKRLARPMLQAAEIISSSYEKIHFASSFINAKTLHQFREIKARFAPDLEIKMYIDKTYRVMEAADVVMLASGTATLETMLFKRPMVVAYRLSWLSYFIVKMWAKIPYASLPNILAGERLVPECLQGDCTPERLSREVQKILDGKVNTAELRRRFSELSQQLRKNANAQAAAAILSLVQRKRHG